MAKLTLTLRVNERNALFKLAEDERRDPRAQAALIIRAELERRGLLPVNGTATSLAAKSPQGVNSNAVAR